MSLCRKIAKIACITFGFTPNVYRFVASRRLKLCQPFHLETDLSDSNGWLFLWTCFAAPQTQHLVRSGTMVRRTRFGRILKFHASPRRTSSRAVSIPCPSCHLLGTFEMVPIIFE